MRHPTYLMACTLVGFLTGTSAQATVGCEIVTGDKGSISVPLFQHPDETSDILGMIPIGDIVRWPDSDFAPTQAEGWTWVRHDPTQENIWQSGPHGWVRSETLANCG